MKRFVLTPTRLAWAALVIGVATYGVMWVANYKVITPQGRALLDGFPSGSHPVLRGNLVASPMWTIPVAAFIAISAVGAVVVVLRRR